MSPDQFLQPEPLSPECQQVHSAKSSRTHGHPTKRRFTITMLSLMKNFDKIRDNMQPMKH